MTTLLAFLLNPARTWQGPCWLPAKGYGQACGADTPAGHCAAIWVLVVLDLMRGLLIARRLQRQEAIQAKRCPFPVWASEEPRNEKSNPELCSTFSLTTSVHLAPQGGKIPGTYHGLYGRREDQGLCIV